MQTVLILGAGLSSTSLIKYFLDHAEQQWNVRVGDINLENAIKRVNAHPKGDAFQFDVYDNEEMILLIDRLYVTG